MLYGEIIYPFSEIQTEHVKDTEWGELRIAGKLKLVVDKATTKL